MTAWPKWWFHSSRQIWTVELCVIDVRWFPCTRLFLGGNCSVIKGNLFQHKHLIYEECSSHFHYIARLFCLFAYLWLWLPQQILTEQGRSFIKGLGNKDSIELLRHNNFFFLYGRLSSFLETVNNWDDAICNFACPPTRA